MEKIGLINIRISYESDESISTEVRLSEIIQSCVEKIAELKKIREEKGYNYLISVDGGVNSQTLESVKSAGADIIVSGSAFFNNTLKWS